MIAVLETWNEERKEPLPIIIANMDTLSVVSSNALLEPLKISFEALRNESALRWVRKWTY